MHAMSAPARAAEPGQLPSELPKSVTRHRRPMQPSATATRHGHPIHDEYSMGDPNTARTLDKVLRGFNAVRHLPPSRIGWRLVQRTRRRLPASLPSMTHERLLRRAAKLPNLGRADRVHALATEKAEQQRRVSARYRIEAPERLAVTIHGHAGTLDPTAPIRNPVSEEHYLWHMSASYLNYLLVRGDATSAPLAPLLAPLAEGYLSPSAWAVAGVHTCQWHPYAASQRLVSLVCLSALHADELDAEARGRIDAAILFHTRYVSDHREYDLHYNHLLKNLFALIVSATYREGAPEASAVSEFFDVLDYQLHDDGGHAELCPMYHLLVLADLIQLQRLPEGVLSRTHRSTLDERVERMRSAARAMSFAHGEIALFADSWYGEAPPPDTLGVRSAPVAPGTVSIERLARSGYVKLATSETETIVDVGPAGPADNPGHSHDDYLALELSIGGERVVSDYGVEAYAAGAARTRTRAAASHNGPTFDGARGLEAWGAFRTGRRRDAPTLRSLDGPGEWRGIEAVHTPLDAPDVVLRRRVSVHPHKGIAIRDTFTGVDGALSPRSVFLLLEAPDELERRGYRCWSPGSMEVERDAPTYQEFGIRSDAVRLTLAPAATDSFLLFTPRDHDPRSVYEELLASSPPPDDRT